MNPTQKRWLAAVAVLVIGGVGGWIFADWWPTLPDDVTAQYVGRDRCIQCHQTQAKQWTGSDHDRAMDHATDETVLGDFDDAEFEHFGIRSRMFRRDGKFFIHTEGPDGKLADFEVKFVFGVHPLQQYMVEFDRPTDMPANEIARLQVLRISWDCIRKRWFYLPPPDVAEKLEPDDDLHWTGIAQRWNNMCADCHSTNLRKNYDVRTGVYHTTYSEIDVSCEACHGPGSLHVQLATQKRFTWDRKRGYAIAGLKDRDASVQVQACAPCHARRSLVAPGFHGGDNFYNHYAPELLAQPSYHPDGQLLDEVYEFGSFTQSKMYHEKGVKCSDCHNPHTTKVRFEGNKLCTSCHAHPAAKYDSPTHHHHQPTSRGALCVECHMPTTTYMEVDPRRDHSLRVPRPDLSVKLGTPNACTACHIEPNRLPRAKRDGLKQYADWLVAARKGDDDVRGEIERLDAWSLRAVREWFGDKYSEAKPHFAFAFSAAAKHDPAAIDQLLPIAKSRTMPDIVRATAVQYLGQFNTRESQSACRALLEDRHPQVRAVALAGLQSLSDEDLAAAGVPLLTDSSRLVRSEAGRILARVPDRVLRGSVRRAREAAIDEFKAGLLENGDRAGAHLTLGVLYENLRQPHEAIACYRRAMRVEPRATGPRSNLAAILDQMAESATAAGPSADAARFAEEARTLRREELDNLARDARLAPESAAIQYRYGLSLYLHDRSKEAEQALSAAHRLEPNVPEFLHALALLYQKQERWPEARECAAKLLRLRPRDEVFQRLWDDLQSRRTSE